MAMPSADEQKELARRAKAGDRDAADALALAVWPWARRKARDYARQYGQDAEELEAIGMAKFPHALAGYDPAKGWFLNYFAYTAAREMVRVARRELQRRVGSGEAIELVASPEPVEESERAERFRVVLEELDPLEQTLVLAKAGGNNVAPSLAVLAGELGISARRARRLYKHGKANVRKLLGEQTNTEESDMRGEVQGAAERLRRCRTEPAEVVYADPKYDEQLNRNFPADDLRRIDRAILADAWLAEHPESD